MAVRVGLLVNGWLKARVPPPESPESSPLHAASDSDAPARATASQSQLLNLISLSQRLRPVPQPISSEFILSWRRFGV